MNVGEWGGGKGGERHNHWARARAAAWCVGVGTSARMGGGRKGDGAKERQSYAQRGHVRAAPPTASAGAV
jgi:hypothetical protein